MKTSVRYRLAGMAVLLLLSSAVFAAGAQAVQARPSLPQILRAHSGAGVTGVNSGGGTLAVRHAIGAPFNGRVAPTGRGHMPLAASTRTFGAAWIVGATTAAVILAAFVGLWAADRRSRRVSTAAPVVGIGDASAQRSRSAEQETGRKAA